MKLLHRPPEKTGDCQGEDGRALEHSPDAVLLSQAEELGPCARAKRMFADFP